MDGERKEMTNITALVITLIATNWISIGTFTDKSNQQFDVKEGRIATNETLVTEWKNQKREFVLESIPGPVVAERKEQFFTAYHVTNWVWGPGIMLTNIVGSNSVPKEWRMWLNERDGI